MSFVCLICFITAVSKYTSSGSYIRRESDNDKSFHEKTANNSSADNIETVKKIEMDVNNYRMTEASVLDRNIDATISEINRKFPHKHQKGFTMHKIEKLESAVSDSNRGGANDTDESAIVSLEKTSTIKNENRTDKDKCYNCSAHNFKIIIDSPDICTLKGDQTAIKLLIFIHSAPGNSFGRGIVRETWLEYCKNNTGGVRYAFLIGEVVENTTIKENVLIESQKFGDIIKGDFIDSYNNLTYKTIMGFKWVSTRCSAAKAVMKTDDDSYVNVPNALKIVRNKFSLLLNGVVGKCYQKSNPRRDKNDKWYVSKETYPRKYYPEYCSGSGYMTSYQIARKIYEISSSIPFFHIEDVFVGMCIEKLGYHMKTLPGFSSYYPDKVDLCMLKGDSFVTLEDVGPHSIRKAWNLKCPSNLTEAKQ